MFLSRQRFQLIRYSLFFVKRPFDRWQLRFYRMMKHGFKVIQYLEIAESSWNRPMIVHSSGILFRPRKLGHYREYLLYLDGLT